MTVSSTHWLHLGANFSLIIEGNAETCKTTLATNKTTSFITTYPQTTSWPFLYTGADAVKIKWAIDDEEEQLRTLGQILSTCPKCRYSCCWHVVLLLVIVSWRCYCWSEYNDTTPKHATIYRYEMKRFNTKMNFLLGDRTYLICPWMWEESIHNAIDQLNLFGDWQVRKCVMW